MFKFNREAPPREPTKQEKIVKDLIHIGQALEGMTHPELLELMQVMHRDIFPNDAARLRGFARMLLELKIE